MGGLMIKRRDFLKIAGLGLACLAGPAAIIKYCLTQKRDMIFGWTTCLTYETFDRKLGFDYFSHLLDEMRSHSMTRLIVMMASHGYYSPGNHGLAWPVKNPKLKPQLDKSALNASEDTEFFSKIIQKAHQLVIEVFIEIKYLGMIGIREGYPDVEFLTRADGSYIFKVREDVSPYEKEAIETLHICCDSEMAHQYMRDKIRDVLERYHDLDGIVLEHPSYYGDMCYCSSSQKRLYLDTGKDVKEISTGELTDWKNIRIRDTLIDLKKMTKNINPKFQIGFYSGASPDIGHSTETISQVGFDFLMPSCEGTHKENETKEVEKVIEYLSPNKVYLHTTIRRKPPRNYPLPPKGPKYINNIIKWGKEYFREHDRFLGMTFFNEVKIPNENRQAVYKSICSKRRK